MAHVVPVSKSETGGFAQSEESVPSTGGKIGRNPNMDLGGLDLNLLVALDALFAEKSVSRAGERRLHLSQSATSGALARLREVFQDQLLVPVGRKMVLTPVAEALVEPVRNFL